MIQPAYQSDNVTLYLGDCLEIMPQLAAGSVDAVVTDPPYGIGAKTGWVGESYDNEIPWNGGSIQNDADTIMRDYIVDWCSDKNIPAAMFGSCKIPDPENYLTRLVWDKGDSAGMGDLSIPWKPNYDFIHIFGRQWSGNRTSSILRAVNLSRISMGRMHPHEKPITLLRQLIEKVQASTILDPFMGSGTTGVACVQTGRKFIGIEIDPGYYAIAEKRIRQAELQIRMEI